MYNAYGANRAAQREMASDMWIQRHVPGGLNSPLGRQLDNYLGGNPNPTWGQMTGGYSPYHGYGNGYGYRRW
ncbi:unnamed protein product [Adineta ricciae]|uniref:Uncharacterized protein n=1 Tax=Adineta ricciae TaxID=249248 RepID=A0A815H9M3_ADIRI|nr:unnamed protein product [Adineta ricciae]